MENKIYFKDLPCYERATEKVKSQIRRSPYYDLTLLPEAKMREEAKAFIQHQGETRTLGTVNRNRRYYNYICRFIEERGKKIHGFSEMDPAVWERKLRAWMIENHLTLNEEIHNLSGNTSYSKSRLIQYFENLLEYSKISEYKDETEKDIWELDKLDIDIQVNLIKNFKTLNFKKIYQPDIREEVKKAIYMHLRSEAIYTVAMELTAMRRLSKFLKKKYPEIETCNELKRTVIEEYIIYLKTEAPPNTHLHTDMERLRSILETVGKIYQYPHLNGIILNRDIPYTPQAKFKNYSDAELKRINACIAKQEIQIERFIVIHQMLGTRISDSLTLQMDCLCEKQGETIIRIKQMKTHPYEKPVSRELAMLISAAIEETRRRYGDTKYIFVNAKDLERPMQYSAIQYVITKMIHDEDLRDDNGELFGFNSHMFRHYYGVKLTEMHLDDWTIARLLGHSSIRNVRYYRKMSNQLLADETRKARNMLSQIIWENLDGWGDEYEQIRQDDSLE